MGSFNFLSSFRPPKSNDDYSFLTDLPTNEPTIKTSNIIFKIFDYKNFIILEIILIIGVLIYGYFM